MRLLSLSFLFFISISSYSQVFGYGYGHLVYQKLLERKKEHVEYVPTIEQVQDIVETKLMESSFPEVA